MTMVPNAMAKRPTAAWVSENTSENSAQMGRKEADNESVLH